MTPLYPSREAPARVDELFREFIRASEQDGPVWGRNAALRLKGEYESGRRVPFLWGDARDQPRGLAWIERVPGVGRRVSLFLSEDHRSPEDLSDVLTDLVSSAPTEEPLLSISGWIVGVSEPDLERLLAPRGWRRAERFDMEFPASALLPELREDLPGQSRTATHADREPLADLMERAYAEDLVERALFVVSRHPHKDARRGIEELLNGELGPWISTASFVRVVDDRLVAATLVNELHGPLITQVMVYPEYRRLGFGADLLIRTLRSIRELGIGVPRLVVTAGNRPAQNLYGRLGFVERLDSRGTVWLNLPALGWSPPPRDVSRFQT